jgi:hypothetical protein
MPHNLSSARKSPTGAVGADADAAAVAVVVAGVVGEAAGAVAAAEVAAGPGAVVVGARSERFPGHGVQEGRVMCRCANHRTVRWIPYPIVRLLAVLGGVVLCFVVAPLGSENFWVLAENTDAKSVDQQPNSAKTVDDFAEARRMLKGPAGNPECVWLGRRVVGLLWRDDLDTAFRHIDMYDRFGCPSGYIQEVFRCLVMNAQTIDPKAAEDLNGRVQACWVNPSLLIAPTTVAVPNASPMH